MSLNADEVRVAANGHVYIAPKDTALPTDLSALSASYKDLGYLSEDGAALGVSTSREAVKVWQSATPVRYILNERIVTVKLPLAQFNLDTVPLYFGGGTVSTVSPGLYKYEAPEGDDVDERVLVLDAVDGIYTYRYVCPRVMAADTDDIALRRNQESLLGVTLNTLATEGTGPLFLLTDDPAFDSAAS